MSRPLKFCSKLQAIFECSAKQRNRRVNTIGSYGRKLSLELCEDRRLLASSTVTVPFDASAPFNLEDGIVTLREAVFVAIQDLAPDTISFHADLIDEPIELTLGKLIITAPVTIDSSDVTGDFQAITIDGSNNNNQGIFGDNTGTGPIAHPGPVLPPQLPVI